MNVRLFIVKSMLTRLNTWTKFSKPSIRTEIVPEAVLAAKMQKKKVHINLRIEEWGVCGQI